MLIIRFAHETDGWTWAMLVDGQEIHRSADRFGSAAGARWDARRRLAGVLSEAMTPLSPVV